MIMDLYYNQYILYFIHYSSSLYKYIENIHEFNEIIMIMIIVVDILT